MADDKYGSIRECYRTGAVSRYRHIAGCRPDPACGIIDLGAGELSDAATGTIILVYVAPRYQDAAR